jgi:hypothetical protein
MTTSTLAFNLTSANTVTTGQMAWNAADLTVDIGMANGVTLQVGQEQYIKVKASEAISDGEAVMFAGVSGEHILAARNNMSSPGYIAEYFIGVATQNFALNEFGYVTVFGKINGLNTLAYTAGDLLYADPAVIGGLTKVEPQAPNLHIIVAAVTKRAGGDGHILVRPTFRPKLANLSDVQITNIANNNLIKYNSANSRFENVSASSIIEPAYAQANSALSIAQSAFAQANTGGAAGTDNLARSIANSAFSTANTANSSANFAFAMANASYGLANSALTVGIAALNYTGRINLGTTNNIGYQAFTNDELIPHLGDKRKLRGLLKQEYSDTNLTTLISTSIVDGIFSINEPNNTTTKGIRYTGYIKNPGATASENFSFTIQNPNLGDDDVYMNITTEAWPVDSSGNVIDYTSQSSTFFWADIPDDSGPYTINQYWNGLGANNLIEMVKVTIVLKNIPSLRQFNISWNLDAGGSSNDFSGLAFFDITPESIVSDADIKIISASSAWTFNDTGSITFPDNTVQNTAFTTATTNAISNTISTVWNTANNSYAQANTATSLAQAAYNFANTIVSDTQIDPFARSQANSAFNQANTATSNAASAFSKANTATTLAQSAYDFANTIVSDTQIDPLARSISNSAFAQANTATTNAATANNQAASAFSQANSALSIAQSAFAQANTGGAAGTDNVARSIANSAFSTANSAFAKANTGTSQLVNDASTVSLSADGNLTVPGPISGLGNSKLDFTTYGANTAYLTTTSDDSTALFMGLTSAELYANTTVQIRTNTAGVSNNWTFGADGTLTFPDNTVQTTAPTNIDSYARNTANTANNQAASAFSKANTATTLAQAAYNFANTIVSDTQIDPLARSIAQSAFAQANTGGAAGTDNLARSIANSAFSTANSALSIAQSAFAEANTGGGATESLNVEFNNSSGVAYKVVALNVSANTVLASALDIAQVDKVLGVLDVSGETVTFGSITNVSWAWTPEQSLYLGSNGDIVTTSTVNGAAFSLKLGYAISATKAFIKIGTPIVL